jgi:hypothetical protein
MSDLHDGEPGVSFPMTCPNCQATTGMPYVAKTMLNGAVCVGVRCYSCQHEWDFEMASTVASRFQPKPDRRKEPRV